MENKNEGSNTGKVGRKQKVKRLTYIVGGLILLFLGMLTLGLVGNLKDYVSDSPTSEREIVEGVGRDTYEEVAEAERKRKLEEELEEKERIDREAAIAEEKRKVDEIVEQEALKEGYEWVYDIEQGKSVQRKIVTDEEAEKEREANREKLGQDTQGNIDNYFEQQDENIEVLQPRDEVIEELAKPLEEIDEGNIYLTKGQFIFWLQDNFLFLVGNNEIQTFWDPETLEARVVTRYGDKEEVEKMTKGKIEKAFNASGYGYNNKGQITVKYE